MRITIQIDTASGEATLDTETTPGGTAQPPATVAAGEIPAIDAGPAPDDVTAASPPAAAAAQDDAGSAAGESAGPAPSFPREEDES